MSETIPKRLSFLDRFLTLWIFLAMGAGLLLGQVFPAIGPALDQFQILGVSAPIAGELAILPGLDEILALARLKRFHDEGRYDVLIIDSAPTGAAQQTRNATQGLPGPKGARVSRKRAAAPAPTPPARMR